MTKEELRQIWESATGLPADGPLHQAIIYEFMEGADPFTGDEVLRIHNALIKDITRFTVELVLRLSYPS